MHIKEFSKCLYIEEKKTKKGEKAVASKNSRHFYLLRLHGSDHKLVTN